VNGDPSELFVPNDIFYIPVGTTVTWTGISGFHSVTSAPGSPEEFGTPGGLAPFVYQHTFNTEGTYYYYCDEHADAVDANNAGLLAGEMVGRVTVLVPPTPTRTLMPTNTSTPTPTNTPSATETNEPTSTSTTLPTVTSTTPPSPTSTTGPPTATSTTGPSPTATSTSTTAAGTPTPTATGTPPLDTPTPTLTVSPTPAESPSPTATTAPDSFALFEGWTQPGDSGWPGPPLGGGAGAPRGEDEITAYFDAHVDPVVWTALALYDPDAGLWGQHFRNPPLPAFQTLHEINPGDALWIFATTDATLTIP
jgi:hypothetical protein